MRARTVFGMMVLGIAATGAVCAQSYPVKPIRIVTSEAGGGNDIVARLVGQQLASGLGQSVVVENRPAGVIPGEIVSRAQADGYTMLLYGGSFWVAPLVQDVPYDVVRDFAPIVLIASTPNVLVVTPSLPVKSVGELIALAKSKPGAFNYASTSTGAPNHLAAELFKFMAGVNLLRVPYRGTAPAMNDLMSGQVHAMFAIAAAAMPHVRSGRLTALAVTSREPSVLAPGLPTVAASGLPGYEIAALYGAFFPVKTQATLIQRLNQEIVRIIARKEIVDRMFNVGLETVGSTPEQFAAKIKSEMAVFGKLIKNAGIRRD